jgi:hypothetical protein
MNRTQRVRVFKWCCVLISLVWLSASIRAISADVVYSKARIDAVGTISTGKTHQGVGYEAAVTFTEGPRVGWYLTIPITLGDYAHYKVGDIISVRDNQENDRESWFYVFGSIVGICIIFLVWFFAGEYE